MTSVEAKLNESLTTIARLERENTTLKKVIHALRVRNAATERKHILRDSGLGPASEERLNKAFERSTDNTGLKEAINVERNHSR